MIQETSYYPYVIHIRVVRAQGRCLLIFKEANLVLYIMCHVLVMLSVP